MRCTPMRYMPICEVHAYVHAFDVQAYKIHAYEGYIYELYI